MLGRDDEWLRILERAHHGYLEAAEPLRALRCAFWVGMHLTLHGETARGGGWLARAQRLLESEGADCVEHGYMLLPVMFEHECAGDLEAAVATAARAGEIGTRFADGDLFALAVHAQGEILIRAGRLREGLGLLDEAMVAVTAGELSPIVTGLVYCGVIASCQEVYELRRAQEWTEALSGWCDRQPDLQAFTGRCLIHRSEIMQLHGAWPDALAEARRAGRRTLDDGATARAFYLQAEVHRLRGERQEAEDAYREASRFGLEPQPGLALLRLEQGGTEAAAAAIRRALAETGDRLKRASLLPACVDILLATGDVDGARDACRELAQIAETFESDQLAASAAYARGRVELEAGEAGAALVALRRAWRGWHDLGIPYDAARARVHVALACRLLGDADAVELELDAARAAFERLGAGPDLARVDALRESTGSGASHGLTKRELEVLRLVAAGKSNREIAERLVISEHTVARHVQNIFAKLRVSSRTAAGAFAFQHDLV